MYWNSNDHHKLLPAYSVIWGYRAKNFVQLFCQGRVYRRHKLCRNSSKRHTNAYHRFCISRMPNVSFGDFILSQTVLTGSITVLHVTKSRHGAGTTNAKAYSQIIFRKITLVYGHRISSMHRNPRGDNLSNNSVTPFSFLLYQYYTFRWRRNRSFISCKF